MHNERDEPMTTTTERQAENQKRAERIAAATPLSELAESIGLNPADYS